MYAILLLCGAARKLITNSPLHAVAGDVAALITTSATRTHRYRSQRKTAVRMHGPQDHSDSECMELVL